MNAPASVRWVIAATLLLGATAVMAADDFKPGETVVAVRATPLQSAGKVIAELTPGTTATVNTMSKDGLEISIGKIGRIDTGSVLRPAEAEALFTAAIEKNPRDAAALRARGKLRFEGRAKVDEAIADLDASLKLAPNSEAHTLRAWAWKSKGDNERAMADFDEAILLDPSNALAWRVRGATWASKKEYPKALADYTQSLKVDPDNPDTLNHRALLLSVCVDDKIRNGKQAVADATKACELVHWTRSLYTGNLASAYAEAGDFDAALKWNAKAMEQSSPASRPMLQERQQKYENKEPIRFVWK